MDVVEARACLLGDVEEVLGQIATGRPVVALSAEIERVGCVFEALACWHLLERLDSEAFRDNLMRSVHARLYFLRRSWLEGNLRDRRLALSRTESLFDALASGNDAAIDMLVNQSIREFVPGWEYEDDFDYFRWIEALYLGASTARLHELARRRRISLGRPNDVRQVVLEALSAGREDEFIDSLHRLAEEIADEADRRRSSVNEFDLEACIQWPRGFVRIELLALIALAGRRGIDVQDEVALAPVVGRLHPHGPDTEDFFAGIEEILGWERSLTSH